MSGAASETRAAVAAAIAYHDRTKHDFNRYARSPGYLDWANQPDPFRRYAGARLYLLPFSDDDLTAAYDDLYATTIPASPMNITTLGVFLENSLAVSASKAYQGTSWKLRCNPSSGNLHPTEGYMILGPVEWLSDSPGVYHYAPNEHGLEQRCSFDGEVWEALSKGFPNGTFFVGLSSIYWREAWKYGERALRYCHLDVGHAIGALRLSSAALGWRCAILDALSDDAAEALLGLDRGEDFGDAEREHGELIMAVIPAEGEQRVANALANDAVHAVGHADWTGRANPLSEDHVDWAVIPETGAACRKPETAGETRTLAAGPEGVAMGSHECGKPAGAIFRQRRSAVAMDGVTGLSRGAFYRMMERTLPRTGRPPIDCWPYAPAIHLAVFVHLVDGLTPGLYLLVRRAEDHAALQNAMKSDFAWEAPPACPGALPLYFLAEGDCRRLAAQVSCLQDIAGYGAFSLGMIARFEETLQTVGPWAYPRLFWEAGLIGQVLYDEAEATGVRSTGIGCYFDDPVHQVLGLAGCGFQSMYHFTVGGPVDDPQLTHLPPYDNARRGKHGWVVD